VAGRRAAVNAARVSAGRLEATVRGRVQGVGYRWFVVRHAARLGLVGWVANEPGGNVAVVAEGSEAALRELLGLLREGPAGALVEAVDGHLLAASGGLRGFTVRAAGHAGD
jgi:acylphosphatase